MAKAAHLLSVRGYLRHLRPHRLTSTRAGRTILAYILLWCLTMAAVWYVSVWVDVLTGHA